MWIRPFFNRLSFYVIFQYFLISSAGINFAASTKSSVFSSSRIFLRPVIFPAAATRSSSFHKSDRSFHTLNFSQNQESPPEFLKKSIQIFHTANAHKIPAQTYYIIKRGKCQIHFPEKKTDIMKKERFLLFSSESVQKIPAHPPYFLLMPRSKVLIITSA